MMMSLADLVVEKSRITGEPSDDDGGLVRLQSMNGRIRRIGAAMLTVVTLVVSLGYIYWLTFAGTAIVDRVSLAGPIVYALLAISLLIESLRMILICMLATSTVLVKKPVLIRPRPGLNVALFITYVPASEDIDVLAGTLRAATLIRHNFLTENDVKSGTFDVFVLDEGDPDDTERVPALIASINDEVSGNKIYHFSRFGKPQYHVDGKFSTKTKYGNINAAFDWLSATDRFPDYDVIMGLDPDHVPLPEFGERMLGYFEDPDIAYVSGPQAYANATTNVVAKLAESQQFPFHALIQTAANTYWAPMLVGTSYAIRSEVLRQIDGIQSSITEDMATSFEVLCRANPHTGHLWKAVYTPDLLAHGQGPDTWGSFYKQQTRWARGSLEQMFAGPFLRQMWGMRSSPLRIAHYLLLMSFYPVMAVTWLLGAVNALLFAVFGVSATGVAPDDWLLFYGWVSVLQMAVYVLSRRHNISPYEVGQSWGVYGMFMSVVTAPVYAAALIKMVLRRKTGFEVTPKGIHSSRDTWFAFRLNIAWLLFYVGVIALICINGYADSATLLWPISAAALSASPIVIWHVSKFREKAAVVPASGEQETVTPTPVTA